MQDDNCPKRVLLKELVGQTDRQKGVVLKSVPDSHRSSKPQCTQPGQSLMLPCWDTPTSY